MSKHIFPAKVGDLVQVKPQPGDYERTVVVECIHKDGRIGVFMPCFGGGAYRRPTLCYYSDEQYVVLAENWREDLETARQEELYAARIKPGDFVRVINRKTQFVDSAFWPGSVYRVMEVCDNGVDVGIESGCWYFRFDEVEKVLEKERFSDED